MRQRMQYLYAELKKTIKMLPRMLVQAIILMALIGMIAFCGIKGMKKEPLAVKVDIGIVVQEENTMTRMALGYVENLESASQVCHFTQVSDEEGFDMLEKGQMAALIVLPEQLVEGIMSGANPSVDVYFPHNAGLEAMLLRELTESGGELLQIAQAQIYGAYDTAAEYGLTDQLSVMQMEIDSYNLAFALDRLAIYETERVSATGRINILQHYAASGMVLFLLFAGMAVYPVMQQEPEAFCKQLVRQGTGRIWQSFCQWLCGFVCMAFFVCIAWIILKMGILAVSKKAGLEEMAEGMMETLREGSSPAFGVQAGMIFLIMAAAVTFAYLLYSVSGSRTGSILLIFLLSVVMVYMAGGFIPAIFLPQAVQTIGGWLPGGCLIRAAGGLFAGYARGAAFHCAASLCMYTALFGSAACVLRSGMRGR